MIPNPPPSPGVGARRKGPKIVPKLPLTAFSPPNSGTSDKFPLPPSPSHIHPENVVDANVVQHADGADLTKWKNETGQLLDGRLGGVIFSLRKSDLAHIPTNKQILSVILPVDLESEGELAIPETSTLGIPVSFSTVFNKSSDNAKEHLKSLLALGRPVDIDIQTSLSDAVFEEFADLLTKATDSQTNIPPIIISNLLPPPHDMELPIVKLMNHPSYRAFQARAATLSLFPTVHIKFLPPAWNAPTPTPSIEIDESESKEKKEWKRRIRMYLGPILEAFGYERIVYGSSPSGASPSPATAGEWYELARESLAELAVDQEMIDGVFGGNARRVYGPAATEQ